MKRRIAALLTCALIAFGQRSKPSSPPDAVTRFVDLLAFDETGRPVSDLSARDFEVSQAGKPRTVTGLTRFDTIHHSARASDAEGFDLLPDEIHRNFIAVVDDLGLSAAGVASVQESLRAAVRDHLDSGELMAVIRTSAGNGVLQQLTGDRRILLEAIDRLQFLGGNVTERTSSAAAWLALNHVLEGLSPIRGRKFVVLFTANPAAAGTRDSAPDSLAGEANTGMATVYVVNPVGPLAAAAPPTPPGPLEELVAASGGIYGAELSRVLEIEQSFYVLSFEEPPSDSPVVRAWDDPPVVTVRRPGVSLRARSRVLTVEARQDFPAPADRAVQLRRALLSPFAGPSIHTRLSSHFSSFVEQSAVVDASVFIDVRDLSMVRDAKGTFNGSVRVIVNARSEQGRTTAPLDRAYDVHMPPAEYQTAVREGFLFTVSMRLPLPGTWRIRAVTADGISDRIGSSVQSIWIPSRNEFAISSLSIRTDDPAKKPPPAEKLNALDMPRVFKIGSPLIFTYDIFQARLDDTGHTQLQVRTRLYSRGHAVYVGAPARVSYELTGTASWRRVSEHLTLANDMPPGEYLLEVTVIDTLASHQVSRFIDFQLL